MNNLSTAAPEDIAGFFEAVGTGIIVFDVDEGDALRVVCTNAFFRSMYGIDHEVDFDCPIHDVLSPDIQKHYSEHIQACSEARASVDDEFPLLLQGIKYWHRVRMVPVFAEDKEEIARFFATSVNITHEKVLEEELDIVSSRLGAIVDSTYDAIVSIDARHMIKTFNQAAEELFGYKREQVIGKNLAMLLPKPVRSSHDKQIDTFGKSSEKSRPMETRVEVSGLCSDETTFPAEVAIAKIDVHGDTEYTAIVRDISVQVRLMEELRQRAVTDPLTELSNRRHLVEIATMEIERCKRYAHPLSVVLLDIDDFKSINDTYGHAVGDAVLKEIGAVLKRFSRKLDIPARWGGEEFCMLIPEAPIKAAHQLCIRLLEAIRGIHSNIPELEGRVVTASIGLTEYHDGDVGMDAFVQRADEAMYEAKNSGKNKVCHAAGDDRLHEAA